MPVDDQDPAYRLVDSDGNIVGTVYGTDSGDVAVQNESGTETLFTDDGIETPALEAERATNRYEYRIMQRGDTIVAINDQGAVVVTGDFATSSTGGESQLGQVLQAVIDDHGRPTSIYIAPPESGDYWYIEQGVTTDKALEIHGTTPMITDSSSPAGHGTTIVPDEDFTDDIFTFRGDSTADFAIGSKMVNIGIFGRPSNWDNRSGNGIVLTDNMQDFYIRDCILHTAPGDWLLMDDISHNMFSTRTMYEHAEGAGVRVSSGGRRFYYNDNYYLSNVEGGIVFDAGGDQAYNFQDKNGLFRTNEGPAISIDQSIFGLSVSSVFVNNDDGGNATVLTESGADGHGHWFNGCWFRGTPGDPPDRQVDYDAGSVDWVGVFGGLYDYWGVEPSRLPSNNIEVMMEKN